MSKNLQPKIRFKGFSDDWTKYVLSDLGRIQTGSTPLTGIAENYTNDGLLWVTPTDISLPITRKTNKMLSKQGEINARIVPAGSILVTCIASIGKTTLVIDQASFNQQINSLTPNQSLDSYFLFTQSYFWSEKMKRFAGQGTMQIVNKTQFSEIETYIANEVEQKKIGDFFQSIDKDIALQEEKLNKTKNLKKAMLEKMFPKEGSKQPEVRFDGFSGDWSGKILSEVVDKIASYSLSRSVETSNHTGYKYIHYGDIHRGKVSIIENIDELISIDNVFQNKIPTLLQKGDLVLADASEDYIGIASPCVINIEVKEKLVAGLHTIALRPVKIDPLFFYYVLKTDVFNSYCRVVGTGTKVFAITSKNLLNFEYYFPVDLYEQQKIGNYFKELDKAIASQSEQLEKLKNIKKAYLAKMFV